MVHQSLLLKMGSIYMGFINIGTHPTTYTEIVHDMPILKDHIFTATT